MHPILLKIGPVTVFSYGAMFALGFTISFFLIYWRAGQFNIDKDRITNLAFLTLAGGIAGARILFILMNMRYYGHHPLEMFDLSKGGLIWYGGFLGGLSAFIWYTLRHRLGFWLVADISAPYLALTQAFGRIGCFLNGCCYGRPVPPDFPFGVIMPGFSIPIHPTQIYSSLALVLTFVILRLWQDAKRFDGEIFLGYCMLYPAQRFFVEFLRGDNRRFLFNLTFSQDMSIILFLAAGGVFSYRALRWKRNLSGLK